MLFSSPRDGSPMDFDVLLNSDKQDVKINIITSGMAISRFLNPVDTSMEQDSGYASSESSEGWSTPTTPTTPSTPTTPTTPITPTFSFSVLKEPLMEIIDQSCSAAVIQSVRSSPEWCCEYPAQYRKALPRSPIIASDSRRNTMRRQPDFGRVPCTFSNAVVNRTGCVKKVGTRRRLPAAGRERPHSNKPYTREEVDFIRYRRCDWEENWDTILERFQSRFEGRHTDASLSSRYYRDNKIALCGENGKQMRDESGNYMWLEAKVRQRCTPEGRDVPFCLVDRDPQRAVTYPWVTAEHKEIARAHLQQRQGYLFY